MGLTITGNCCGSGANTYDFWGTPLHGVVQGYFQGVVSSDDGATIYVESPAFFAITEEDSQGILQRIALSGVGGGGPRFNSAGKSSEVGLSAEVNPLLPTTDWETESKSVWTGDVRFNVEVNATDEWVYVVFQNQIDQEPRNSQHTGITRNEQSAYFSSKSGVLTFEGMSPFANRASFAYLGEHDMAWFAPGSSTFPGSTTHLIQIGDLRDGTIVDYWRGGDETLVTTPIEDATTAQQALEIALNKLEPSMWNVPLGSGDLRETSRTGRGGFFAYVPYRERTEELEEWTRATGNRLTGLPSNNCDGDYAELIDEWVVASRDLQPAKIRIGKITAGVGFENVAGGDIAVGQQVYRAHNEVDTIETEPADGFGNPAYDYRDYVKREVYVFIDPIPINYANCQTAHLVHYRSEYIAKFTGEASGGVQRRVTDLKNRSLPVVPATGTTDTDEQELGDTCTVLGDKADELYYWEYWSPESYAALTCTLASVSPHTEATSTTPRPNTLDQYGSADPGRAENSQSLGELDSYRNAMLLSDPLLTVPRWSDSSDLYVISGAPAFRFENEREVLSWRGNNLIDKPWAAAGWRPYKLAVPPDGSHCYIASTYSPARCARDLSPEDTDDDRNWQASRTTNIDRVFMSVVTTIERHGILVAFSREPLEIVQQTNVADNDSGTLGDWYWYRSRVSGSTNGIVRYETVSGNDTEIISFRMIYRANLTETPTTLPTIIGPTDSFTLRGSNQKVVRAAVFNSSNWSGMSRTWNAAPDKAYQWGNKVAITTYDLDGDADLNWAPNDGELMFGVQFNHVYKPPYDGLPVHVGVDNVYESTSSRDAANRITKYDTAGNVVWHFYTRADMPGVNSGVRAGELTSDFDCTNQTLWFDAEAFDIDSPSQSLINETTAKRVIGYGQSGTLAIDADTMAVSVYQPITAIPPGDLNPGLSHRSTPVVRLRDDRTR